MKILTWNLYNSNTESEQIKMLDTLKKITWRYRQHF